MKVAKKFAAKLKLNKTSDWKLYLTGKIKGLPSLPDGVPQNPNKWYQNDPEWKGGKYAVVDHPIAFFSDPFSC